MKRLGLLFTGIMTIMLSYVCCIAPFISIAALVGISSAQLTWLVEIKIYLLAMSSVLIFVELLRRQFTKTCCDSPTNQNTKPCKSKANKKGIIQKSMSFLGSTPMLILTLGYSIFCLINN